MSTSLLDLPLQAFGQAQQWLFEAAVQPLMLELDLANVLEDGYRATGWLLVGVLQMSSWCWSLVISNVGGQWKW